MENNIVNLIKKIAVLTVSSLFLSLAGCASNETTTDTTGPTNGINEKMKNSQVSADAARLINSKVDDEELAEKLICVREKVAGSNFKKKICPVQKLK